ncbi:Two pore calcium channel protein 2 [Branchiostoma belcheri]|nr:Two pore calcium channel protein 2 [Branchiostoma belcheri]
MEGPETEPLTASTGSIQGNSHAKVAAAQELFPEEDDEDILLQAVVFVEDAIHYRSIHHRVDRRSLRLYRLYYSNWVQWGMYAAISVLLVLAFFERPSSLSYTSDTQTLFIDRNGTNQTNQWDPPCGVTESIELFCLLIFLADFVVKTYLVGKEKFLKSPWLIAYVLILLVSLLDWMATLGVLCVVPVPGTSHYRSVLRIRRFFRPFFLLQNSSLMKKTVNCIKRTLPEIFAVLVLQFLHVYFFTIVGMLLFSEPVGSTAGGNNSSWVPVDPGATGVSDPNFHSLWNAFITLLVLLTTANNPDVMMTAYSHNRLYAVYFILFLAIGLYLLFNMMTAVIYNQFRGYLQSSLQGSFFRRRVAVRAAFEVLSQQNKEVELSTNSGGDCVRVSTIYHMIEKVSLPKAAERRITEKLGRDMFGTYNAAQFQAVFDLLDLDYQVHHRPPLPAFRHSWLQFLQKMIAHRYFEYLCCAVALSNILTVSILLTIEYDQLNATNSDLELLNFVFVVYYLVEQCLKFVLLGWRYYRIRKTYIFDALVTFGLVIVEVMTLVEYGSPFSGLDRKDEVETVIELWDLIRITNILIMFRLLRVISLFKTMSLVLSTLLDLIKNMRAFAGILVVIYYFFAILGIEIFSGVTDYETFRTVNVTCGSYQQLNYWANNFNDFASALVVLWDVMVVNNWMVFLFAYKDALSTGWAQLFFIVWWLVSVVVYVNCFIALVLENFITKWDKSNAIKEEQEDEGRSRTLSFTEVRVESVHHLFRSGLTEPKEEELLEEIRKHQHLEIKV